MRVARELFDLTKIDHPNVHRLQGVMMFKGQHLGIVSEWADSNLYEYLVEHPGVNRYQLCTQVASGLDYMHRRGKVHGNLKAVNVVVSSDGIAKLGHLDSSAMSEVTSLIFLSNNHSWPGTIRWAAPEMLLEEVTEKTTETDVYALGMTMLEVFAGHAPYPDCRSDISVIRAVDRGTLPARPTQLGNNHKDDKMWQLLVRCWSRRPSERPLSTFIAGALEYMS
ncbi:unnamed protein product [Rhizoctonia solani]|uniref:Protein kinase domain-containing protein n=1 Tax=Rhizoctonia solani TaxID=456999 RepID=A0A8H3HZQ8_9AGAM|nr:unnamed protein product [Rhizoctonia solani]